MNEHDSPVNSRWRFDFFFFLRPAYCGGYSAFLFFSIFLVRIVEYFFLWTALLFHLVQEKLCKWIMEVNRSIGHPRTKKEKGKREAKETVVSKFWNSIVIQLWPLSTVMERYLPRSDFCFTCTPLLKKRKLVFQSTINMSSHCPTLRILNIHETIVLQQEKAIRVTVNVFGRSQSFDRRVWEKKKTTGPDGTAGREWISCRSSWARAIAQTKGRLVGPLAINVRSF